jgi:hypothetical protein
MQASYEAIARKSKQIFDQCTAGSNKMALP